MVTESWVLPWTPDSPEELRIRITILLAPNYMGETDDPVADAAKLAAAVDSVIATLGQ